MEKSTDSPNNQSSSENVAASDQIESEITTPPDEREAASASNDTDQEKTASCMRLPSCFTTDDRSGQTASLADTSGKMNVESIHAEHLINTNASQCFSLNHEIGIAAERPMITTDCGTFFGIRGSRNSNNATNKSVNMEDHPSDRCITGVTFPRSSNKMAMWRARQKANETEEAKQARLNKERDAKSNQRQKRYENALLNERILRQEQAAVTKAQQRHIRDSNETDETRETRMSYEASRKNTRRHVQHLQESDDVRHARMIREANVKKQHRDNPDIQESEDMRQERLDNKREREKTRRFNRDIEETEEMRLERLRFEAESQSIRRFNRDIKQTEDMRDESLYYEAERQNIRRFNRDLQETEDMRNERLDYEVDRQNIRRFNRAIEETEDMRHERLDYQTEHEKIRRFNRNIEETEDMTHERLDYEADIQNIRRFNRNIQQTEDMRDERLDYEARRQEIRRLKRDLEETEQMKNARLKSEREWKRTQRSADNNTGMSTLPNEGDLGIYVESQSHIQEAEERNEGQTLQSELSTEVLWPKIPTVEIKRKCLIAFNNAMSNAMVEQVTCVICACRYYKKECLVINIGCIPNQHLLYPTDELPSCVIRLNIDVDPQTKYVQITESIRQSLVNSKDSSAIINKMLLYWKAIDLSSGCAEICEKCYEKLSSNKLRELSLSNLMWLGDVPPELQCLTLSEQKLIALYRHSSCVIKLFSATRDPSLAQTALKGNVITFPQSVSDIARSLPLSPNELPDLIKIIFVGRTIPNKEQARSILTVRREIVREALIWLHRNNILYKDVLIDHLIVDKLPVNDVPDSLWDTLSIVDRSESDNIQRSGYADNELTAEETNSSGPIPLATSALIDTCAATTSSGDIARHLIGRFNVTDEMTVANDDIYLVPHGQHPVNEYFNTALLPGLYPTLFPYGVGGVENEKRPLRVSYSKHMRYFLSYHDHRFEMNSSFIFVNFNILQRRAACSKARILVSRPYFTSQAMEINQITAAEVKTVLSQIESSTSSSHTNPRISTLLKQVKTVEGTVMGSNQARAKCRVELHAQIFSSGLPSIFITINPCDLHHPLAMKFAGVDLDVDNLIPDMMPGSQERAAIVASHPVSIARFFNKLIETVLSTLIGYNHQQHRSHPGGGVLGEIEAYYGTVEESGRGALHLHMLLWLVGNVNPSGLRESIKHENFRDNLIKYLEDIIKEDLSWFQTEQVPSGALQVEKQNRTLSSICSPIPTPQEFDFEEKKRMAICTLVVEGQIHRHTSTCYKYASTSSTNVPTCRMRYPKQLHDVTTIDIETGEIRMRRAHPMLNNFNEWLLMACRCNMDIKFIWSGGDTKALVYYITDYITKRNLSFHDTHVLIHRAIDSFTKQAQSQEYIDAIDRSRRLILRCFNTLASQQEISSVQVASYLMGWPDHYCSHTFVNVYLIGIERYLEKSLTEMRDQSMITTNQLAFNNIDGADLSQSFCDIDDYETPQDDEAFEVETGCDNDHLVLCNRRVDYQMRSLLLNDICLYSFFSEYRKAKMTLRDKNLLQGDSQPATTISRGRPLNDRWLFRAYQPQYSTHILIRGSFAVVPVLIGPATPRHDREDTAERHVRAILTLFHPWTTVFDICHVSQSWSEASSRIQTRP